MFVSHLVPERRCLDRGSPRSGSASTAAAGAGTARGREPSSSAPPSRRTRWAAAAGTPARTGRLP